MLIFSSLWLQPLHSSGFFDAAPTICEVSTYCGILLRWCMLATTHNSDDYDDTIINWNLKKLANFDTPRTNFEKFPNKFTFCSEQILTFFSNFDTPHWKLKNDDSKKKVDYCSCTQLTIMSFYFVAKRMWSEGIYEDHIRSFRSRLFCHSKSVNLRWRYPTLGRTRSGCVFVHCVRMYLLVYCTVGVLCTYYDYYD